MLTNGSLVAGQILPAQFPQSRTSSYEWFEDFSTVTQNTAITTTTSAQADGRWSASQSGAATCIFRGNSSMQDANHMGVVELTNSTATTGIGLAIFKGGGGNSVGQFNPTTALFDIQVAFKLAATTNTAMFIGLMANNAQATIPATNASTFIGLRYDTSVPDSNYMWGAMGGSAGALTSSGIAADTSWHRFRMRAAVAGTVLFSLDGGTEVAVSSNISNSITDFVIQQINRTSASAIIYIDYVAVKVSNLTR